MRRSSNSSHLVLEFFDFVPSFPFLIQLGHGKHHKTVISSLKSLINKAFTVPPFQASFYIPCDSSTSFTVMSSCFCNCLPLDYIPCDSSTSFTVMSSWFCNCLPLEDARDVDIHKTINIWRMKKLIKQLENVKGVQNLVSLLVRPGDKIDRIVKMLTTEFDRVNHHNPLLGSSITLAQEKLKLYNSVPTNGLVVYTGTIVSHEDGNEKEKVVSCDFEPLKPIASSWYIWDNIFHTKALNELLKYDEKKYGFIVMDGYGTLFGMLSGSTREVLYKFVCFPTEKRQNYVKMTAEFVTKFYVNPETRQPNVTGLIIAGTADFKNELSRSDMFDPCLHDKILNVVDVPYGGENGFNHAIEKCSEILSHVKFYKEKLVIGKFFKEIDEDTDKYVVGLHNTLNALEMGVVETLIVWEDLDMNRYVLKNSETGERVVKHLNKRQEAEKGSFQDSATSAVLEVQEKISLLEWFIDEYKRFGCKLEIVTINSQEGKQFCRGFKGIGGILRDDDEGMKNFLRRALSTIFLKCMWPYTLIPSNSRVPPRIRNMDSIFVQC